MATVKLLPTSYTRESNQLYVSNGSNLYTDTSSDTYARITHTKESSVYNFFIHGFETNKIPEGVRVTNYSVKIKINSARSGITPSTGIFLCYSTSSPVWNSSRSSSYSAFSDTGILKSNRIPSSPDTYTFPTDSISWSTLNQYIQDGSFGICVPVVSDDFYVGGGIDIYGAEIEVTYDPPKKYVSDTKLQYFWNKIKGYITNAIKKSDWEETDTTDNAYILNKPYIKAGSGTNSIKENYDNTVTGNYAHAEGYQTMASGIAAHAEGHEAIASGNDSHAEGQEDSIRLLLSGDANALTYTFDYKDEGGADYITPFIFSGVVKLISNNTSDSTTVTNVDIENKTITVDTTLSTEAINNIEYILVIYPTASGQTSHVEGMSVASGIFTHAEGRYTEASGPHSHAEGYHTQATGSVSHTEGYGTLGSGDLSHAEGQETTASGKGSHAEGYQTTSSGQYSHAEGGQTTSSGQYSHAEGSFTTASASQAHAEGFSATASGTSSHAEGSDTTASKHSSHAEGYHTTASGDYSHAEGDYTAASEYSSHAEGSYTTASGGGSHAEGYSTIASKDYSHAEGYSTTASGPYSHAEGFSTIASYNDSHAEGKETEASGMDSHAEGYSTTASGSDSHAEGYSTTSSGTGSHAEGSHTTASGASSHAEGGHATASGINAHAEGNNTIAQRRSQHVFGEYNIADTSGVSGAIKGNYVEIVGNGTEYTRSNARTLDWSGNEVLAGKLTVGTGPTANMDVATKQYVDAATAGITTNLSGLTDTTISSPANGQILVYDSTTSKWINSTNTVSLLKEQIYNSYPNVEAEAGPIVSITDGADGIPVKSLVVGIEPVQSGSGDPSPTNVRPISGWTGANVQRTGKNLLEMPYYDRSKTEYGVTFTVNNDGSVSLSGTNNRGNTIYYGFVNKNFPKKLKKGSYSVGRTGIAGATFSIVSVSADNTQAVALAYASETSDKFFTLSEDTLYYSYLAINAGTTVNATFYPRLELGSTATDYEPYQGDTYPIAFPSSAGTVYGGSLDVTAGVLTVDRAMIASYAGETLPGAWISDRDVYAEGATPTTGAQIVYELATPITYQLTHTEVTTLLGSNSVWADTGDTSLAYRADTKLYIDGLYGDILADYADALTALG